MKPVRVIKLKLGLWPLHCPGMDQFRRARSAGVDLRGDIRKGLPLADASVDCVAAIHALQDLAWADTFCALREVRRILKPGGVLRLAAPDLDKAIRAYMKDDGATSMFRTSTPAVSGRSSSRRSSGMAQCVRP